MYIPPAISKAKTRIEGFDEITLGGLPRGRTTLVMGNPGSGKTIMALQSLVNGARLEREPGIFVAFEEDPRRTVINAGSFGWDLDALGPKKLFFLDARPKSEAIQAGAFVLGGMLAALDIKVREMRARRIVFDAIDVVLTLIGDPAAERHELYRLHEWLLERELTAIITAKSTRTHSDTVDLSQTTLLSFLVDCTVLLSHEPVNGVSERYLCVNKYRGSAFAENDSPLLIGPDGMEVAGAMQLDRAAPKVSGERVSSGIARLDAMLNGGYYRGASVLITGSPGTAKSTLGGAFIEAACRRGERSLFVGFDSDAVALVRNLTAVNIHLERFVKRGLLHLIAARAASGSPEVHLMRLRNVAKAHRARCLVIDPVSALAKLGTRQTAHHVVERLIDWTKSAGITLLCTSLLDSAEPLLESTPLEISTIADTWIHLSYQVKAGERNRALSIVKARGTPHSNQVRELVLGNDGITMADVYMAGGEVLMGTLRWEKERAVSAAQAEAAAAARQKMKVLQEEEAEVELRLKSMQRELEAKRAEMLTLNHGMADYAAKAQADSSRLRKLRGEEQA